MKHIYKIHSILLWAAALKVYAIFAWNLCNFVCVSVAY